MKKGSLRLFCALLLILCCICESVECYGARVSETNSENKALNSKKIVVKSGMDLYGLITDETGKPIRNIAVSDGYQVVLTNDKGVYEMKKTHGASFVYYTTPSEYEINTVSSNNNIASFYQAIDSKQKRYDFQLKKLAGGVEYKFNLLAVGDPQVRYDKDIKRLADEIITDINETVASVSYPSYVIVLGDVMFDRPALLDPALDVLATTSVPLFTTVGNHDKLKEKGIEDSRSVEIFTKAFGPLNYSFDRGNVHLVCLDNVRYKNADNYVGGFTDEQVKWLEQDLENIPSHKMIILYYHIPIGGKDCQNKIEILEQLRRFSNVHLMCGHTHYTDNVIITEPFEIYEHVHAATCGSWWHSVLNGDGTPLGYGVFQINGSDFTNWYYKSVQYDKKHQIRLYRGNASFGGEFGHFTFGQHKNDIIANIWNADKYWRIEVYEDGVFKGEMQNVSSTLGENIHVRDVWAKGYHVGVKERKIESFNPPARHLFLYRLVNPDAKVKVVAIDQFGNRYEEDEITTDMKAAGSYVK